MVMYTDPWPHMVIDNYYAPDVYNDICKKAKKFLARNVTPSTRKQEFPFAENSGLQDAIDSRLLTEDMLENFPDHRDHTSLSLYWEVNYLLGPFSYKIHDESERKVLSSVVYVTPEENSGTRLYDKEKRFVKEIEWKPNRALIFAAIDGVTWHDYTCPRGKYRITINQFLQRSL